VSTAARKRLVLVLRLVAVAACVALFVHALAHADLAAAWTRIRAIGPLGTLVLVPFAVGLAFDAAAVRTLLAALGRNVKLSTIFGVRLVTEAVNNTAPAGAVFADAAAPLMIAREAEIPVVDAFAASTAKRWLVVRMHGVYVAVAVAIGVDAISRASSALLGGRHSLPLIVLVGALVLVASSFGIEMLAARMRFAARTSGMIGKWTHVRAWIAERRHHFEHADTQLLRLSEDRRAALDASARLLAMWMLEGVETWLILRLLGANLGFAEVISFDAALSIVRSAAVFAPAGIGVQDVGYLAVLEAYGVPAASGIGPAFVVIKRLKELLWIAIGFLFSARKLIRPRPIRALRTGRHPQ
jgi:uncharacterized protein (TIRG00374 family)